MDNINNKEKLYNQLVAAHGKIMYTYTAHHKMADRLISYSKLIKRIQIGLTGITSCGFLALIIYDGTCLKILGGLLSTISLCLNLYTKGNNFFNNEIKEHQAAANDLWEIREAYVALLTDFNVLPDVVIREKRDELTARVSAVNRKYAGTDSSAYKEAQKALKKQEEQTFNPGEAEKFLPVQLRKH
jgi:hypothetical protein